MRVLTIQEPFATLIMSEYKKIETRSWKTSYRGEIYIHAGKSNNFMKMIDPYTKKIIGNLELNYGSIICKTDLIDCIEMTEEFIEKIKGKDPDEYKLGFYEKGRYAWVFGDIEALSQPIKAEGKLNIWSYQKE